MCNKQFEAEREKRGRRRGGGAVWDPLLHKDAVLHVRPPRMKVAPVTRVALHQPPTSPSVHPSVPLTLRATIAVALGRHIRFIYRFRLHPGALVMIPLCSFSRLGQFPGDKVRALTPLYNLASYEGLYSSTSSSSCFLLYFYFRKSSNATHQCV